MVVLFNSIEQENDSKCLAKHVQRVGNTNNGTTQ